ncbi:MAG TPA: branched-chain amino acid transaminase [Longimicrobiales bacterium]|nr:branched-chain amino acid transaminase [Longimicrobiales bacterium]
MAGTLEGSDWIWKDGDFVAWEDAQVHLLATAVQFGTSMFEGIRCYETPEGPSIFRLDAHIRRLLDSCKIYRMQPEWTRAELEQACLDTVARNGLRDCYVRPMVLRGYGAIGLDARPSPIETYVACWPWGTYLGPEALQQGVDICTSSWMRAHPNTFPVAAKAAGNYLNAQLIKSEAIANGYAAGVAVSPSGLISEGGGQNIFLVRDDLLITPFLDGSSLRGITRDAVVTIAHDLGYEVREQHVPRESLYIADELFFTGTATEVTPIRSVDRIEIGEGKAGPVSLAIQERYFQLVRGEVEDPHGWRTVVPD